MPKQIRRPEFRAVEAKAREKERQRCARIAEKLGSKRIAKAIRADDGQLETEPDHEGF